MKQEVFLSEGKIAGVLKVVCCAPISSYQLKHGISRKKRDINLMGSAWWSLSRTIWGPEWSYLSKWHDILC